LWFPIKFGSPNICHTIYCTCDGVHLPIAGTLYALLVRNL
jgi:hypothetical protein